MVNQKKFYGTMLAGLLLLIGLGYAYFSSNLSINGDALFRRATWNIHWLTPSVSQGSVSGTNVTQAAHVTGTNSDTVEYAITLTNPKDYYEFTVDAKNEGSMDAMISTVSNKLYNGNTEATLPDYLTYSIKHTNGASVKEKQILRANSTQSFKVRVYYRDDIDNSLLPVNDTSLSFEFRVTYVQADNTAIEVVAPAFNEATPWEDVIEGIQDGTLTPTVGDTKTVDMGTFGTHILRVANTTTPAECSTTGFSQTACGLVLEFADIIKTHKMNSTLTSVGGWPASELRVYVNGYIYNALPTALKNAICDTTVVSGHGYTSGETNFTSTDKLYLLSTHEVWEDNDGNTSDGIDYYDSAYNNTRQLDYYAGQNVTNSSYSGAIKQNNESNSYWWLRSAYYRSTLSFSIVGNNGGWYDTAAINTYGFSPAFRLR